MRLTFTLFITLSFIFSLTVSSQELIKDTLTYTSIENALTNPKLVKRLDLSNQSIDFNEVDFNMFENLEFLSLKNDHIVELPASLFELKNLKILDLSGNDFETLPKNFFKLKNLEELYLNDERNLDVESALITISKLPNLKYLHLENDNLEKVPNNILRLKQLEMIYLNDNKIKEFPEFMRDMEKLYFIDMQHNLLSPAIENQYKPEGRMKIKF